MTTENIPERAVGIERLHVYPATLSLSLKDLVRARGMDAKYVHDDLMVRERSVNPPWEDTVTMAVNAARPLVEREGADAIGFLIVASESGVDQEKSLSSWVHRFLGLGPGCRNLEVKYACYGATGALNLLLAWLQSDMARGKKALLINADQSLISLGEPHEAVGGAGAVAILLSNRPRLAAYETDHGGVFASEVADVFRPTPRIEMGNGDLSLLSYMEGLDQAYADYVRRAPGPVELDSYFDWHVYHMPFPGIALRAHRALLNQYGERSRAEIRAHYARKCEASIAFPQRIGTFYGGSTFVGLLGLASAGVPAGGRVGIFSYGSGSCSEFLSARFMPEAADVAREAGLPALLDDRLPLSVDLYETVERTRDRSVMAADFVPDPGSCGDWYDRRYAGRALLVLDRIEGYYRHYRWS